jgi:hypothetical protein
VATESSRAKPDWYADPTGRHQYRYWDGAIWTADVADSGQASVDPLDQPETAAAKSAVGDATARQGTGVVGGSVEGQSMPSDKRASAVDEQIDHSGSGVFMASGHYGGCKLVASIDAESGYVCALEVQFKDAAPSEALANEALSAWRPALAAQSLVIRDSLVAQGWQTSKPFGSPYIDMDLVYPGHHVDRCCHGSTDWKDIEP